MHNATVLIRLPQDNKTSSYGIDCAQYYIQSLY